MRYTSVFFAVAAMLFLPQSALAYVEPLTDIRVTNVTDLTATIEFTPPPSHVSTEREYYYNYRLYDANQQVVDVTAGNYFFLQPLQPNSSQTFHIRSEKIEKDWQTERSYIPVQVDSSELSRAIEVRTTQSSIPSRYPTPQLSQYNSALAYRQFPSLRFAMRTIVYDADGIELDREPLIFLDDVYGESYFTSYDFVNKKFPEYNTDDTPHGSAAIGVWEDGAPRWMGNNVGQGGIAELGEGVDPSTYHTLQFNRHGVEVKDKHGYVIYDTNHNAYIHVYITDLVRKEVSPPSVAIMLKEKGSIYNAAYAKWKQPTYRHEDVDAYEVRYRCLGCENSTLKRFQSLEVHSTDNSGYYSVYLPLGASEIAGHRVLYQVQTKFANGQESGWSLPVIMQMAE